MPRYAAETTVPVERSRAEIEATVRRYNATKFTSGWDEDNNTAFIMFHIEGFYVRFTLPLPSGNEKRFTHRVVRGQEVRATENQRANGVEQEIRQRWRALLLAIKGKLEAVDCKISSITSEFMAFIVLPNDKLLGEWLMQEALPAIKKGTMPQLGFKKAEDIQDAEVIQKAHQ